MIMHRFNTLSGSDSGIVDGGSCVFESKSARYYREQMTVKFFNVVPVYPPRQQRQRRGIL
jgi:hypothetical protein